MTAKTGLLGGGDSSSSVRTKETSALEAAWARLHTSAAQTQDAQRRLDDGIVAAYGSGEAMRQQRLDQAAVAAAAADQAQPPSHSGYIQHRVQQRFPAAAAASGQPQEEQGPVQGGLRFVPSMTQPVISPPRQRAETDNAGCTIDLASV